MNIINTDAITVYCQVMVPPVRHESLSHPLLCLGWAPLPRAPRVGRDPRYSYHFYTIRALLLNRTFYFVLFTTDRVKYGILRSREMKPSMPLLPPATTATTKYELLAVVCVLSSVRSQQHFDHSQHRYLMLDRGVICVTVLTQHS